MVTAMCSSSHPQMDQTDARAARPARRVARGPRGEVAPLDHAMERSRCAAGGIRTLDLRLTLPHRRASQVALSERLHIRDSDRAWRAGRTRRTGSIPNRRHDANGRGK
jgi:hypothetical protein